MKDLIGKEVFILSGWNKANNIVLIGFMGTGKSTIATALAERLAWQAVDSDQWIEAAEGMTIADIFKQKGEPYFRQVEMQAIKDIMRGKEQVVASGGGAVLAAANREAMMKGALVVALHADVDTIVARVSEDESRPLLADDVRQRVNKLLAERKHAYDFAELHINTAEYSVAEAVEEIVRFMNE